MYIAVLLSILVAIIDTGISASHAYFSTTALSFYNSYDGGSAEDTCNHGTAVAGVVVDHASEADLLIIKATEGCYGRIDAITDGIRYAVDSSARVVLVTMATATDNAGMREAIDYAMQHDVLVVASVGNRDNNTPFYPSAYDSVLAVAGWGYSASNFGDHVDVAAPGESIYAPSLTGYAIRSGTSMAAPQVAGLAATLLAIKPELTVEKLRTLIESTAMDVGDAGHDDEYGYGLINADIALAMLGAEQKMFVPLLHR